MNINHLAYAGIDHPETPRILLPYYLLKHGESYSQVNKYAQVNMDVMVKSSEFGIGAKNLVWIDKKETT